MLKCIGPSDKMCGLSRQVVSHGSGLKTGVTIVLKS